MLIILLVTLTLITGSLCDEFPLVKTPLGSVRGYHKQSHDGRTFTAFEGIPYAKPPIGNLRFEEPEPIEPWVGVWNASFLSECAQSGMIQPNTTTGEEDCLHINVYVPRSNPDPSENLDVIIHIHGGAYMYLSGHFYAHPEFIMDRDVIWVTFNYRLGILGFLSTEDEVVPGNNGLKDQVLALKWVQENIESFGGNPKSVTLTGFSAGGSSVHLQYFSPLSKGLFKGVFAQSGFALNPWSVQENPLVRTKKLADAVGCPTSDTKILVDCLKQRPQKQLLDKVSTFFSYSTLPPVVFGPVVEKGGSKPFLTEDPYVLLKKGKVHDVPLVASTTTHEAAVLANFDWDYLDKNWETLAADILEFNNTLSPSLWASAARKIKEFYLEKKPMSEENWLKVIQILTDRYFTVGAESSVRIQSKVTKSPVYYFTFGYPGDNNPEQIISHALDTKFYFGATFIPGDLTQNELKMKDLMINMMISFAKTGKPVFGEVDWKPTGYDELTYLKVNGIESEEITLETVAELTPISFWDSLNLHEGENLIKTKDEL